MDNRFIPGELVLAEDEDLAPQFGDDLALVLGATVLEPRAGSRSYRTGPARGAPSASAAPPVRVKSCAYIGAKTNAMGPSLPDGFTDNQI